MMRNSPEWQRLKENTGQVPPWHKWGPYVSERMWGTVREDYSPSGDVWHYTHHDLAPAKTFRWGEDGIAGISDRYQLLILSFAFWNEKDKMLKERLFGLAPFEGNHGEDVKECYYYSDNTPTHSYMRYLYKYPHASFPYEQLREENQRRSPHEREFELIDTGIFNDGCYFDIEIEYAKKSPEDLCVCITATNRGKEVAPLHLIPQLCFRKRILQSRVADTQKIHSKIWAEGEWCLRTDDTGSAELEPLNFSYHLHERYLYGEKGAELLFTNNETNSKLLYGKPNISAYVKDAFHQALVKKKKDALNPDRIGTKAGMHYQRRIEPGASWKVRLRFSDQKIAEPLHEVDAIIAMRRQEADQFFQEIHPEKATDEEKRVQRAAFSGLMWNKQMYLYLVTEWLSYDGHPPPEAKLREKIRNKHWKHLVSMRILSMPDKWEYPWFAAWDLAFHTIPIALIDYAFAKEQLWLLLFDQFQHPNGQIPAYEWEFSELNPPVQSWAALKLFDIGKKWGERDVSFLKKCFHKLVLNFVWWVNRVDASGNNVFEGGFLGLDNITIFDRSVGIPGGGTLEQSDGAGWMCLFCLTLMRMALELAQDDSSYELMAVKFFEHFVYICSALHESSTRDVQIWDPVDGFFYDVLRFPSGHHERIKVRSLVGIIPLFAVDAISQEELDRFPLFANSISWFLNKRKDLTTHCVTWIADKGQYLLAPINLEGLKKILEKIWDPAEFRAPFGLRSLSRVYEKEPYTLLGHTISYEPGEATSKIKGGNSNWRGPVWVPTTYLCIESLRKLHRVLGDNFSIAAPGESPVTLYEMGAYFANSLIRLFLPKEGRRPFYGEHALLQNDPHFKDHLLFYEHFHGETGRGLGACHQTGWTALVATLIDEWRK